MDSERDQLQQYVQGGDYFRDRRDIDRWSRMAKKALLSFGENSLAANGGWPYEWRQSVDSVGHGAAKSTHTANDDLSQSTTAMSLFMIDRCRGALRKTSPFTAYPTSALVDEKGSLSFVEVASAATPALVETIKRRGVESKTWGIDEPATIGWLLSRHERSEDLSDHAKGPLTRLSQLRPILEWKEPTDEAVATRHMLPTLRAVQLWKLMAGEGDDLSSVKGVEQHRPDIIDSCRSRLSTQVSAHGLPHGEFDAAELVFATEALTLLEDDPARIGVDLLRQVFHILSERQRTSPYWRPLQPITQTRRGVVLLPISVEIANSVLRIHARMEKAGLDQDGAEVRLTLARDYARWLDSRFRTLEVISEDKDREVCGWCSEHMSDPKVIHSWETAQVIVFLADLVEALELHMGHRMREGGLFEFESESAADTTIGVASARKPLTEFEPLKSWPHTTYLQPYQILEDQFIDLRGKEGAGVSMLLSGPPGTGKSTLAKNLASGLGWKMLTLTPSDFIAEGSEQVESRAKAIFAMLKHQRRVVILLDEIDRLILDRDRSNYDAQGDMFQAMTPSMLVKIAELRDHCRDVVFIIGTNYRERIDPAIARPGRIDYDCVLAPPNLEQRAGILSKQFMSHLQSRAKREGMLRPEQFAQEAARNANRVQTLAGRTSLMVFKELDRVARHLARAVAPNDIATFSSAIDGLPPELLEPAIRLETYAARFRPDLSPSQMPLKEFWLLFAIEKEGREASGTRAKGGLAIQRAIRRAAWATLGDWSIAEPGHLNTFDPKELTESEISALAQRIGELPGFHDSFGTRIKEGVRDHGL